MKISYFLRHIAILLTIIVLFLIGTMPVMAKKKKNATQITPVEQVLPYNAQLRYNYFFLEAARQQNLKNYDAAFDLLQHAKFINPYASEVYYMQGLYYSELKQDSLSIAYLEKASSLNPNNLTYLEHIAQSYIGSRQYDKAIERYELLSQKNRKNTDPLQILLQLYEQEKNYPKMIETLNRIELQDGANEQLTLNKVNVYETMGDKKMAYQELKSLSDSHPNDLMYKTMLGNWLMQNERQDEAYKIFKDVLEEEPDNNYALSSLYDYYGATHQDSLAEKLLEKLLVSDKTSLDTKTTLMRSFINSNESAGGDSIQVLSLFDHILSGKQPNSDLLEMKAAYMTLKNMPKEQINSVLSNVLNIAPDNASARLQLIQNLWAEEKYDSVIVMAKPALQYNPDEMAFYYFLGLGFYQKHQNDEALNVFQQGVSQINSSSNQQLVSDFYAIMGDIFHEKGRRNEAFAAYDSCLQWKDDNIVCLNNYAYYLSEDNVNLKKAEEMSYKTIVAEPKNSTFLDTYAWILFCEERYADAKTYIDQVLANIDSTADNKVILEHVGDIYSMNGMQPEALKYWEQSLKAGNTSKALPKKIKLRKYIKE